MKKPCFNQILYQSFKKNGSTRSSSYKEQACHASFDKLRMSGALFLYWAPDRSERRLG